MKNFLSPFLIFIFLSCSGTSNNVSSTDSANAIEDHPLQDTQVAPFPDGYAPPNTEVDTSKRIKDSINALKH